MAESVQANNSRKGCPGPITCSVHGHIVVDLCSHDPRCIRPPREDVYCCLAMKEEDPQGWASQQTEWRATTQSVASGSRSSSIRAEDSQQTRYSGTSALEEGVEEGLLN